MRDIFLQIYESYRLLISEAVKWWNISTHFSRKDFIYFAFICFVVVNFLRINNVLHVFNVSISKHLVECQILIKYRYVENRFYFEMQKFGKTKVGGPGWMTQWSKVGRIIRDTNYNYIVEKRQERANRKCSKFCFEIFHQSLQPPRIKFQSKPKKSTILDDSLYFILFIHLFFYFSLTS